MKDAVYQTYVKGIYCAQCPEMIISGLLQTRGVIDADVAYFQSLVTVTYDPELVSEQEICSVLADLDYPPFDRRPSLSEQALTRIAHLFSDRSR